MTNNPIIKIEELTKKDGKEIIFENVSFEIKKHQFVSLKGPSGCGKTTFLRILSGLMPPSSGKIFIKGVLANSPQILIPPHERVMNLLFQDLALWPHMTGYEQLKFVWESSKKGILKNRILKVCNDISLPNNLLTKYPSQLSRGEQQRLAIARTLIAQPEIILLDEPLTALDQDLRTQFITFLKNLKKERTMTVILVSHDLMTDLLDFDKVLLYQNNTFKDSKKS
ncbi:hypothetical protein A2767_05250 [Candidatus Roizmanbacteria bacterium RIFCSPHIGHO2_01_FULL_35_10]|uniref:ABC transporter domain-containing protein n=1 Tax=Candidatus Roizmanbacteria bacterium RIFCSPLOWO2_01_FULL_35_13 TaxID=1802055 RepID=A0A1F7IBW3_9BACT|nr:MAG: hypothetical protein A2767_05250 [Candidatus Roizmanbacteria bacterium RIFCSPHIGHO2_01_FULL_35_10]OGK40856.1 MAG: hypothetical protein A3A74_05935 [Candidatus Roizmanbacteria bacterium RIFCSPLOWO2_01_FULL_35_13]